MDVPDRTEGRPIRRRTIVLIVVLAACLVLSSLAGLGIGVVALVQALRNDTAWPGADDPPTTTITWHRCTEHELMRLHAQCGYLAVPLDWANPGGARIRLAVSRIRHTASKPQGVMVVNPGGPGGSGVDTVDIAEDLPSSVAALYDWVGFDPRGVGDSLPALQCDDHYFDGPRPGYSPTEAHVAAWTARARAYAKSCTRNGPILRHMTTVDSAHDIETLRIALGQDRIDYYGYSYGTYLGQTYATLYPDRIRRMILDSTEDSRLADDEYGFVQDPAFEQAMRHYFSWVATWDDVYHLGSTGQEVRARFDAVGAALGAHPLGAIGAPEWNDVFLDAAYDQSDWPDLTDVFVEQVRHPDRADLEDAYDTYGSGSDNGYAAYLAVQCTDGGIDTDVVSVLRHTRREAAASPFATWGNTWYGLPCAFWPAPSGRAIDIDGARVESVLMIDETLDAATPYGGSLRVRDRFPGARLVAEPGGTSHAQTPDSDSPCVLHRIVRYLTSGELPPRRQGRHADATCPPAPEPVPSS